MKIKDVQVEGFGVWSGLSVDSMPDNMTVFYGPNEAGKTTLMQFLRSMFYGYTAERRTRYLPPIHGGRPGGVIRVTGPGGGYEVARRAQLDDTGVIGQLTVSSNDGVVQGQHRLAMLLGQVDESIFTNVFAIGLRELQELNTLDDTAAADELYKLSSGLDRVSLVDVIRQLKNARKQIVGPTPEDGQMQKLLLKREKLRDELDELNSKGRRWSELAAQRKAQQTEIDELRQRSEQWSLESRSTEVALQVRDPWLERKRLNEQVSLLAARTELADDSEIRLKNILDSTEQKNKILLEVRDARRAIRNRAERIPVRKSILELTAKIEAASEQAPWIATLQKQIQRLETDVSNARDELAEDAKRLGLTEEDQKAILHDKRLANIPDLSSQSISQLAEPARDIRVNSLKFKQCKDQGETDKKEADRLKTELAEFLGDRGQEDLHVAIQRQSDFIATLRSLEQLNERADRLAKQKKEIEQDAVKFASDEALPVDRAVVMSIPFVFGGCLFFGGLAKLTGYWFKQDANTGLMLMLSGIVVLFIYWTLRSTIERGANSDLDDCEDELESITKQVKKAQQERDDLERSLPTYSGTIEQRIRDAERDFVEYENLLPVYHNQQAALQRYQSARKRAVTAAEGLKASKAKWKRTLQQFGLAESLSPKSIRILAEGYDSLLQSRARLTNHEDQLSQRKLELDTISQRVETLVRQVNAAIRDDEVASVEQRAFLKDRISEKSSSSHSNSKKDARLPMVREDYEPEKESVSSDSPVTHLQSLTALLAEQQTFVQQRKEMREEYDKLSKQQKSIERAIDKLLVSKSALLTEFGVESPEQLRAQLDKKQQHVKLHEKAKEQDERIRAIIGGVVPYESVAEQLSEGSIHEIERRWEGLQNRIQQADERVAQLLQRQGETTQEMKSLASNRRLSAVKLEIACLEKQLAKTAEHWRTLAATTHMLEKVCEVYETERQPETLREASSFLKSLTEGKYVRVWTPLGKNALRIDNASGQSLPLEVLSRGTREAVFIALRLSLAAAYSRRGVMLPLVMDDVLVNFDTIRARSAARVLRDFADLGHQVIMFTCHEHIMRMFYDIGVQVRVLPPQGRPGEALIFKPEIHTAVPVVEHYEEELDEIEYEDPVVEQLETIEEVPQPVAQQVEPEPEVIVSEPEPVRLKRKKPRSQPRPVEVEPEPAILSEIDHLWYELDPIRAQEYEPDDLHTRVVEEIDGQDLWWQNSSANV